MIELRSGPRLALVLTISSVFVVYSAARNPGPIGIDVRWLDLMVSARGSPLLGFAKALDVLGSPWVTVPIRIGMIAFLLAWRRRQDAAFVALAWLFSAAGSGLVKLAVDRPRPPVGLRLVDASSASFPSGHTIAVASIAVTIVLVFLPPGRRRIGWAAAALAIAAMGWSRTYLGAHWLSDVLAGALIGITASVDAAALLTAWDRRRRAPVAN